MVITLLNLRGKCKKRLRSLGLKDLQEETLCYHKKYFTNINENDPSVIRFKELIEKRNIKELRKEWKKLSRKFLDLERKAGFKGRPLIMDYYHWYELNLDELIRRAKNFKV